VRHSDKRVAIKPPRIALDLIAERGVQPVRNIGRVIDWDGAGKSIAQPPGRAKPDDLHVSRGWAARALSTKHHR
jgi:hypothetical protein